MKKRHLLLAWRMFTIFMMLVLPFSTTSQGVVFNYAQAAPGYLITPSNINSEVTGALELSISGIASATPYVGNPGAGHQFVSIDWEPGVRSTYDIITDSHFNTVFSGNNFTTTWTPVSHTYTTSGTKTVVVKVHHKNWNGKGEGDASEFQFNVFIPQAALNVIKNVEGGTLNSSDFTINVSGTNVSDSSFPGSATGTLITLNAGAYSVTEDVVENYTGSFSADCSGSITSGQTKTCTITNTFSDNPQADLFLTKEVDDTTPIPGDQLTYLISIENLSDDTEATNVDVTDVLPVGVTYVSDDAGGSYDSDTREWSTSISSIAAGGGIVISIVVEVDEGTEGNVITNTASVVADEDDSNQDNNSDDDGGVTVQTATFCGDGTAQDPNDDGESEFCDDGDLNGTPNKCNLDCTGTTTPVCGNDIKEDGEACDGEDGEFGEFEICGEPEAEDACEIVTQTHCGDGTHQEQNEAGNGGTTETGDEECDGSDNVPDNYLCNASCILVQSDDNASICGVKFDDSTDYDQTYDLGDSLLNGWVITLQKFINESWETVTSVETGHTENDGEYCFTGLSSGDYQVSETLQDNWFNSTALEQEVTLSIWEEATVNFGNFQCVDEDEDGYFWPPVEQCGESLDCDDSDSNLNVDCEAVCGDGVINQGSEECDGEDGQFGENEACGEPETEDACQIITLPFCGDTNLDEGEECDAGPEGSDTCTSTCVLIDTSGQGQICGYKFFDSNQDGIFDMENEEGIGGWTIFAAQAQTIMTTVTDDENTGRYCFNDLDAGEWTIYEQLWDLVEMGFSGNWATTTVATTTVSLATYLDSEDYINFGNIMCTDEDGDGHSSVGGVCGPVDCNDENGDVHEGATEICDDGIDNNCDGLIDSQDSESCSTPEEPPVEEPTPTPPGGGGGGGGFSNLIIHTERTQGAEDGSITVTITWHTNKAATSRVVWDTQSHDALFESAPNYGYANSTATFDEDPKVTFHSVSIVGLDPNTTYYFRPISAASPEVYGVELEFTTTSVEEETPEEEPTPTPTPETPTTPPGGSTGGGAGTETPEEGTVAGVEFVETPEEGTVAGVEFAEQARAQEVTEDTTIEDDAGNCSVYIWVLLILNLIAAAYAATKSKDAKKSKKNLWWIMAILIIVPTILGYADCWLVVWLLITLILSIALVLNLNKKQDSQTN